MTITEYFNNGYKIMQSSDIYKYPFYDTDKLALTENILSYNYGMRELFYNTPDIQTTIQNVIKGLFDDNFYCWNTLYNTTTKTYDMFQQTNITDTTTGTTGSNSSITITPNTTRTMAKRTYNNATFTDIDKETNGGTEQTTGSNSGTNNTTNTRTGKENLDHEEVLKKEREIAMFNFISEIAYTIANNISLLTYSFDDTYDAFNYIYPSNF